MCAHIELVNKVPLDPPPSNLHMWSNASRSRLLFSSFEIPSEGVMSPTMAIQNKFHNVKITFNCSPREFTK